MTGPQSQCEVGVTSPPYSSCLNRWRQDKRVPWWLLFHPAVWQLAPAGWLAVLSADKPWDASQTTAHSREERLPVPRHTFPCHLPPHSWDCLPQVPHPHVPLLLTVPMAPSFLPLHCRPASTFFIRTHPPEVAPPGAPLHLAPLHVDLEFLCISAYLTSF